MKFSTHDTGYEAVSAGSLTRRPKWKCTLGHWRWEREAELKGLSNEVGDLKDRENTVRTKWIGRSQEASQWRCLGRCGIYKPGDLI